MTPTDTTARLMNTTLTPDQTTAINVIVDYLNTNGQKDVATAFATAMTRIVSYTPPGDPSLENQ